jgi:diguanylate cyclase (GGDEF)-like protein/PAS domain S-box-containing protein
MPRADQRRAIRERMALSVAESEARHRAVLSALPDGVLLQDADGNLLLANPRACDLLGITAPENGLQPNGVIPAQPEPSDAAPTAAQENGIPGPRRPDPADHDHDRPSGLVQLAGAITTALQTGEVQREVDLPVTVDGQTRQLSVTSVPLLGDDGRAQAVVSSFTDATDRRHQAAAQRRGEDMFRQTMQHSPIGVALTALNGRFLRVNRTLCRMLGYRSDELQARTLYEVMHPEDVEEASLRIGRLLRGDLDAVSLERRYLGQGGMQLWGLLSVTVIRDSQGRPLHFVAQVEDVSEMHRAQELLTHMTLHDPLTGLANRTLVLDQIQKALDHTRSSPRQVAVLQCDVDHFRLINDSAGHEQGDAVLVEVGRRVSQALRAGHTAGRLGGDEFVVCAEVDDEAEASAIAEHLQHTISTRLVIGKRTLVPTVSVGISVSVTADDDPLTLLRDADIATYRAKERGRNRWDVADGTLRQHALERLDIEQALRSGIAAGELELHFQPIVDVTSRAVVGREALVRWNHPTRGLLAPMLFLPVAEESGLIIEVGAWVLAAAAKAAAAAPNSVGYVAINVSPNQVTRPGLAESVEKALAEAGLPADRLVIELTESVMLSAAPSARREIEQLDGLGVRIVVDDFGTGFSALSYLRDLPVSGIKVDRSFTAGLGSDSQCERIVEALTGLGHGLGVDVVVEGVETEQQCEILASIGAEHAQGYLFGRPNPAFDAAPA